MRKTIFALLAALAIAGCATNETFREGRSLIETGHVEEGLAELERAVKENPRDVEARNYYLRQREVVVQRLLMAGDNARGARAFDQAEEAYRRALRFDADNARAKAGIELVQRDRRHQAMLTEAQNQLQMGENAAAALRAREVLAENPASREARTLVRKAEEKAVQEERATPQLNAALKKPITLEFREASLRSVFELISKHTGLNFIFDREVSPELRATVYVKNTSIEDVIRFVLVTNQLERKVLNENTILIYPNTPAKTRDYRELVVKSFYLANADVKQTANMVRQLVKTRDLFIDEKLNLLVIRDTAEAVRLAEKLVANQDLGEPEVMLEVEVLEVGHTLLSQIGVQWPTSLGVSVLGAGGVPGQLTGREARNLNGGMFRLQVSDPLLAFNFRAQDGRTNVLANPRIRVKNKDKARIHIGDKVPVITTTAGSTGFVSEAVNYLDVGLKLEVEPTVFLEDEVGIKVGLEVSNIAREIRSASGTVAYQVGTRNASTNLRLKDGETQVLAGLINDEDRRNANRVPGLSEMPGIGRIFSNNDETVNKTEIVLLITPRVVRNLVRPDVRLEEFKSGTEGEVGGPSLALPEVPGASLVPVPPAGTEQAPAPGQPPAPAPDQSPAPGQPPAPAPAAPRGPQG